MVLEREKWHWSLFNFPVCFSLLLTWNLLVCTSNIQLESTFLIHQQAEKNSTKIRHCSFADYWTFLFFTIERKLNLNFTCSSRCNFFKNSTTTDAGSRLKSGLKLYFCVIKTPTRVDVVLLFSPNMDETVHCHCKCEGRSWRVYRDL